MLLAHGVPGDEIPTSVWDIFELDKIIHTALFTVLVFAGLNGLVKQNKYYKLRLRAGRIILIFSIIYAIILESLQFFIFVGRSFELYDLLADFIGVAFGFILFNAVYGKIVKLLA